ncbi:MAG: TetR/AcrR family transcriptional regulator [Acidimicrobiia bacterium]|nr:TetR/AcrR family transcriptional regulator [Acidimicrobiia bacterium]MBT8216773.1 TetR/AcrR family transcriptional regulator [Acidimicrobiia bacterium]NNF08787.1 TetR/AcrR family transcriptional regulator [Acidimicrobiia bacterium]
MAKPSRRANLLNNALAKFQLHGYDGTSVADIVEELGMSKAAFGYHIQSKDQLLVELVTPLLDDLEAVLDRFPDQPTWPDEGEQLLGAYLDVLLAHRSVVMWIDGDKAVLMHPAVGKRLGELNRRMREAIRGDNRSTAARLGASAALSTLWRPLRNLPEVPAADYRVAMVEAALAVVRTVRE